MSLGLPAHIPAAALPADIIDEPDWVEFTLPASVVTKKFFNRFTTEDLTFRITELDPVMMEQAAKRAGGTQNNIKVAQEMTMIAILKVGDWDTKGRYDDLKAWWSMIGFKGKTMVQRAMETLHNVEDEDVDMFLASARPKS